MLTIPNFLSGVRLAMVPVLLWLAWNGERRPYLVCLAVAVTTDFLDGLLARLLKQASELGAKLDSWADFLIYLSVPVCAWWLWPDVVRREAPMVSVAVASYVAAALAGVIKFRRLTSYHTWMGKVAAVLLPVAVVLLLSGLAESVFDFAVPLVVAAAVEEIGITIVLRQPTSNVPSIWHALRLRKRSRTGSSSRDECRTKTADRRG
jgi:phosphatidylglycerophosphate synthase